MYKSVSTIVFLSVIFLSANAQDDYKTEIKVKLSEAEYIYSITDNTRDSVFISAYQFARTNYNPAKDEFVIALTNKLLELNPDCKLATYFSTFELKDKINYESLNQEVIAALKEEIKQAKEKTIQVLQKRIESAFKTSSAVDNFMNKTIVEVKQLPEINTYTLTINKKTNKQRFNKLLETRIELGFWETYENSEIWQYLNAANIQLKEILTKEVKFKTDITGKEKSKNEIENPLFGILLPSISNDGKLLFGCKIGTSKITDTLLVNKYLALPEIKYLLPRNLKFLWAAKPEGNNKEYLELFAIKISSRDGLPPLNGDYIIEASSQKSYNGSEISITMNAEGARIWSRITKENIGRQIAMVINNAVYSAPVVNSEINGGKSTITGGLTEAEANYLANILNATTMPKISVKVID